MTFSKTHDYVGYSDTSLNKAILDALIKAGKPTPNFEIVETRSSQHSNKRRSYQVLLMTFCA